MLLYGTGEARTPLLPFFDSLLLSYTNCLDSLHSNKAREGKGRVQREDEASEAASRAAEGAAVPGCSTSQIHTLSRWRHMYTSQQPLEL